LSLDLQFLPQGAKEDAGANKFADHSGEDRGSRGRKPGRDRRPPRRDNRDRGDRNDRRPRGERPRRNESADSPKGKGPRRRDGRRGKAQRPQAPQLELKVDFVPDAAGVESIAKEIRLTGRSYPLFQIALLVLERPARYTIQLRTQRKNGGAPTQRLFACKLDDTVWLNQDQAVRHVLDHHFENFYAANKVEVDAPRGNFPFVAQCGVTDKYLGPPNHHDYQNKLIAFHAERLPRMPFEKFKSRIRICKEEEAVNAWLEQAKWKIEYTTKPVEEGGEVTQMENLEAVETHFRATHLGEAVDEVNEHGISGEQAKALREPRVLAEFLRDQWHRQKHFPMQLSTHLSRIFSGMGLQFFKKDKKVTHVSVAKPNYLDVEASPVSDTVKSVMEFIEATENCTRRQILEKVGDMPPVEPGEPKEGEGPSPAPEQTEEQKQLISDLHWLIHQGHVLEFSNGIIETAKKPRKQAEAEAVPKVTVEAPAAGNQAAVVEEVATEEEPAVDKAAPALENSGEVVTPEAEPDQPADSD
jgi:hypothetical protein